MAMFKVLTRMLIKIYERLRYEFHNLFGAALLRCLGVHFETGLNLFGFPIVERASGSTMTIGKNVILCSDPRRTALGVNHPVILRTESGASLSIGDGTGISGASIYASVSVKIGKNCLLGANVTIADTDFHPLDPINRTHSHVNIGRKDVVIGHNVFLGTGTIVLKGVHIGENSVIGAGSVVTRDIPPNSIAAGNPCRVIRPLPSAVSTTEQSVIEGG